MLLRRGSLLGLTLVLLGTPVALAQETGPVQQRLVVVSTDETALPEHAEVVARDALTTTLAVPLSEREVAEFESNPAVVSVEDDEPVYAASSASLPWGLDRIDQRSDQLDGRYRPPAKGKGVDVFVVDSGVARNHPGFSGRVKEGFVWREVGSTPQDCSGHGTHVAGIAASDRFGVAPGVRVHPVRVLNCWGAGTRQGVIAGLQWVKQHLTPRSVVTLSLSGSASPALDRAVRGLTKKGAVVVAAAGNAGTDACRYSPGRVAEAVTVAALSRNGRYWSLGNHGECVDITAPGVNIPSIDHRSATGVKKETGTSMAVPHVAGAAAIYWELHRHQPASKVVRKIAAHATTDAISNLPEKTPSRLLHVRFPQKPGEVRGLRAETRGNRIVVRWRKPKPSGHAKLSYRWRIEKKRKTSDWTQTRDRRVLLDRTGGKLVVQPRNSDFRGPRTVLRLARVR